MCRFTIALVAGFLPTVALSHNPLTQEIVEPAVIFAATLLLITWTAYCLGSLREPPTPGCWWTFQVATIIAAFTLFGPLDEWAETNTAAHMVQHMLMMVVIAPLWVLARPLPQWNAVHRRAVKTVFTPLLLCVRYPVLSASIHGAVIWLWHSPKLYILALEQSWWHTFEHFCFLLTAGVFWWSVLRSQQQGAPQALLALLFTLMHTGFLGALLTFARTSLYGEQRPLSDQQLAGLLMWVLGGFPYFSAAIWVAWRWFRRMLRVPSTVSARR